MIESKEELEMKEIQGEKGPAARDVTVPSHGTDSTASFAQMKTEARRPASPAPPPAMQTPSSYFGQQTTCHSCQLPWPAQRETRACLADSAAHTGPPTLSALPHNNRLIVRLCNPGESYPDEETVSCIVVNRH